MLKRVILPIILLLGFSGFVLHIHQPSSEYEIVFATKTGRDADIAIIQPDGNGFKKLLDVNAADSGPSFSPDGKNMVFHSERNGWWKIWTADGNGDHVRQLSFPSRGADYDPTLSPDVKWVAFSSGRTGNEDIFLVPAKGGKERNLTAQAGDQRYPRWTADGRIIYYQEINDVFVVSLMDKDGGNQKTLDLGPGNNFMADMAADGRLVFSSDRGGQSDLYLADEDGTNVRRITDSGGMIDWRAKWSPDGTMIVFERSDRRTRSQVWLYDVKNDSARSITHRGYNYGPTWRLKFRK